MTRFHPTERLRNVGVIAHVDAGKTTLSERLLYLGGRIHRVGEVHDGDTTLDHTPQERAKGITITAAATSLRWTSAHGSRAGQAHRIDLIDTPGHVDFTIEVERALRVLDGAVVVLDASEGVEPQSETVWRQADRYQVPRLVFINKMDKVGADFGAALASLVERLQAPVVPIQWPIGEGPGHRGLIDLVRAEALHFDPADRGQVPVRGPIPGELAAAATAAREQLVERVAEVDEEVLARWLEGGAAAVDAELLERSLRSATLRGALVPVLLGSAYRHQGVSPLLDAMVAYLPSPADRAPVRGVDPQSGVEVERPSDPAAPLLALAFKVVHDPWMGTLTWVRLYAGRLSKGDALLQVGRTRTQRVGRLLRLHAGKGEEIEAAQAGEIVAVQGLKQVQTGDTLTAPEATLVLETLTIPEPVAEATVEAKSTQEVERLATAVGRMAAEDPSLQVSTDPETGLILLRGMGELHLEIAADKLRTDHGVEVRLGRPAVSYRQTLARAVELTERLKVQNGGPGMFAQVSLRLEPTPPGSGVTFVDQTRGGAVPRSLLPAVEKGARGALAGGTWPVVDVQVALRDGQVHERDSTAPAFERVAAQAVRRATLEAGLVLLEPRMAVELRVPEALVGEVLGDLLARRGEVRGTQQRGAEVVILGEAPLAELFGYTSALRSRTHGRGVAKLQFARYARAAEPTRARAAV